MTWAPDVDLLLGVWHFDPRRDGFVFVSRSGAEIAFQAHALYPKADTSKYPVFDATPGDAQG